jgi:glycosyltransferase involved in cell wall biosynthesis
MKVCYLIPMLDYATGWGRWTVDLLEKIVEFGVEPILVVPESQRREHAATGMDKFETHFWGPEPYLSFHQAHRVNFRGLRDLRSLRNKFAQLKERDIALVHAADLYPWGYFARQLKEETGAPVILTNHSKLLFNPRISLIDLRLCRLAVRASDRVVSVSDWSSRRIQKELGMDGGRFTFVHNGVNFERMAQCADDAATARPSHKCGPVVLSVTRFIPMKGIETSVLAFAKIKEEIPEARYFIVGPHSNPRYVARIRNLIATKGIRDVYLPGKTSSLDELAAYYRDADLLLHTSRSESFGLIFLEAGYFGVPVVATAVGGVPEVVMDGENGLLVPDGDADTAAEAMRKILTSPALARRLGDNNRKRALENTTHRVASDYYKLYTEIIKAD